MCLRLSCYMQATSMECTPRPTRTNAQRVALNRGGMRARWLFARGKRARDSVTVAGGYANAYG